MEYAVLFLPLIGSIVGYFGRSLGNYFSELATSFFVCASTILSFLIFYNGINTGTYGNYIIFEWIDTQPRKNTIKCIYISSTPNKLNSSPYFENVPQLIIFLCQQKNITKKS